jgi:hypothetical protein
MKPCNLCQNYHLPCLCNCHSTKDDPKLGGVVITGGGSLTPEILDDAFARILKSRYIPCGCEGNPHLLRPGKAGEITLCVNCGYCCVVTKGGGYRPLNEEENQKMYEAFKSLMDKAA